MHAHPDKVHILCVCCLPQSKHSVCFYSNQPSFQWYSHLYSPPAKKKSMLNNLFAQRYCTFAAFSGAFQTDLIKNISTINNYFCSIFDSSKHKKKTTNKHNHRWEGEKNPKPLKMLQIPMAHVIYASQEKVRQTAESHRLCQRRICK